MVEDLDFRPPEGFEPPTLRGYPARGARADSADHIRSMWRSHHDDTAGTTGIYLAEPNVVLVANRSKIHHGTVFQVAATDPDFDALSPRGHEYDTLHAVPFASVFIDGKGSYIDLPESGGGLSEAVAELGVDNVSQVQGGSSIDAPEYLFEMVWAAHLLDHPPSTEVGYEAQPDRRVSADPNYYLNYVAELEQPLAELRFAGYDLPDPIVQRDL